MIYAEQGNRVTQISENEVAEYVEKGYKIIDSNGFLIQDSIPNDIPNLKLAYTKHVNEIKRLNDEVDKLNNVIRDLKNQLSEQSIKKTVVKEASKVEEDIPTDVPIDTDVVVAHPITTRKRKSEAEKA